MLKMGWLYGVKNRLKEIRMKEYMMNITQFAELLGYDMKIVSSWERGISRPVLETALDIAKKLRRNVNDIWYLE